MAGYRVKKLDGCTGLWPLYIQSLESRIIHHSGVKSEGHLSPWPHIITCPSLWIFKSSVLIRLVISCPLAVRSYSASFSLFSDSVVILHSLQIQIELIHEWTFRLPFFSSFPTVRHCICVSHTMPYSLVYISGKMVKATSIKDVDQHEAVKQIAHFLKKSGKVKVPEWSDIVKLGANRQLAPIDPDWYYIRTASIARRLYIRSPTGKHSQLTKLQAKWWLTTFYTFKL